MCGIVGYIGKQRAIPILIQGLKKLEYRGYDSAGIAYFRDNNIEIKKCVGRIKNLEDIIDVNINANIGIGHTRWATHGGVNVNNCHPHQINNITIVHNGILENYQELKNKLINVGYKFNSDTDTEVLCAYIDYEYTNSTDKDMINVLSKCLDVFKGSYAVVVIVKDIKDKLFIIKKDSPLVIGIGNKENFIASDISAFIDNTSEYVYLEDDNIGVISSDVVLLYKDNKKINYEIKEINHTDLDSEKDGYEHYMLKEINEQSNMINKLNKIYLNNDLELFDISKYKKIHIVACGTAYHAGLVGKYLIENYSDFEVNVYIASEYRYQQLFVNKDTLIIAISQSGETADTIACLKRVKELGCDTLGIVNVKDSSIARIVDKVIYTEAGPEIAVASTKAYVSQVYILSLIAMKIGIDNGSIDKDKIIYEYNKLPQYIDKLINLDYKEIVKSFYQDKDIFFLGRNIDYASVLEGSLKLKEISYIHSEAYPSGELKHGTISLIEDNTCVMSLITHDETATKTISNIKEVKARGAYVLLLIKDSLNNNIDEECYDDMIVINDTYFLTQPILNVIPMQLIAYYVAKLRGCDIDKPRNLAKSVTVE